MYEADVYNGLEELPNQYQSERKFTTQATRSKTKRFKFDLAWEGTHYRLDKKDPGDSRSPIRLIRWMSHLDLFAEPDWIYDTPAQYERVFIGQSSGYVAWEVRESQAEFYAGDRENARNSLSGKAYYDHAIFATDRLLQKYEWPVKSGYYFNPGGTYRCTVHTAQYKNTDLPTEEHAELVKQIREAFYYDSALIYVNKYQQVGTIGHITEKDREVLDRTRGLLKISQSSLDIATTLLESTLARDDTDDGDSTHELLREVLEGYKASDTWESFNSYIYREQTNKQIWLVEETTVIEFLLRVPDDKKMYTHVNMRNGNYLVRARIYDIQLDFTPYLDVSSSGSGSKNELRMDTFVLDAINVAVIGSMYDDRQ
jgi:hypothetical protein